MNDEPINIDEGDNADWIKHVCQHQGASMMLQSGIGVSVEAHQDENWMILTEAHGGSIPVPLTLEETLQLGGLLIAMGIHGHLAFDEPLPDWIEKIGGTDGQSF